MSSAAKLTLPAKLEYGFLQANKLIEEIIDLFTRHDRLYMIQPEAESQWRAVQQNKLEAMLTANNAQHKSKLNAIAKL